MKPFLLHERYSIGKMLMAVILFPGLIMLPSCESFKKIAGSECMPSRQEGGEGEFASDLHAALQVSSDLSRQHLSGQSFGKSENTNFDAGLNIAFNFLKGLVNKKSSGKNQKNGTNSNTSSGGSPNAFLNEESVPGSEWFRGNQDENDYQTPLALMTRLQFIQKGGSEKFETGKVKTRLNYLEIPVYALYRHFLSSGKIFGGFGPYVAYGLGGKIKITSNGNVTSSKAFEKDFGYKRFDGGIGFVAGFEMESGPVFHLEYELGLANLEQDSFDKTKNRTASLNISYPIDKILHSKK